MWCTTSWGSKVIVIQSALLVFLTAVAFPISTIAGSRRRAGGTSGTSIVSGISQSSKSRGYVLPLPTSRSRANATHLYPSASDAQNLFHLRKLVSADLVNVNFHDLVDHVRELRHFAQGSLNNSRCVVGVTFGRITIWRACNSLSPISFRKSRALLVTKYEFFAHNHLSELMIF
jgi:uncharacterized DUF497 family protein